MKTTFSYHAIRQFKKRAAALGLPSSLTALRNLVKQMKPEKSNNKTNRFHLFKRTIIHGPCKTYTAFGWRFIVVGNKVVTVERVRPEENYAYLRRKG
jgi:hypothetical protein